MKKKDSYTVAIAGKGGSGKTTLAALIIRYLLKVGKKPILAVDADPNANLNEVLGIPPGRTLISTVDDVTNKKEEIPAGVTKERYLEYQLNEALVESDGFDLLTMGRTEGPGCYCYANTLLRNLLDKMSESYPYVVMDNEAGMEHLSRRTTRDADALLIVANPNAISLRSAKRIYATALELKLNIGKTFLVVNNTLDRNTHPLIGNEGIDETGLGVLGTIPYDEEIVCRTIEAKTLLDLNGNSPAVKATRDMMEKIL